MSVDSNGKENFFATVNKTSDLQKKRTEKKAAEKKAAKLQEKKAEKKAKEERIQKARDKKAEKADPEEEAKITDDEEYVTLEADSMDELLSKVQTYSFNDASGKVMAESERMVGTKIDFRG
jgi:hypothetical protein